MSYDEYIANGVNACETNASELASRDAERSRPFGTSIAMTMRHVLKNKLFYRLPATGTGNVPNCMSHMMSVNTSDTSASALASRDAERSRPFESSGKTGRSEVVLATTKLIPERSLKCYKKNESAFPLSSVVPATPFRKTRGLNKNFGPDTTSPPRDGQCLIPFQFLKHFVGITESYFPWGHWNESGHVHSGNQCLPRA